MKGRHEHRFADFVGDHGEVLAISIPGGEARVIRGGIYEVDSLVWSLIDIEKRP